MKATERKPHATHPAAARLDEAETDTGVLAEAMVKKHHHKPRVENDGTDMPGVASAADDSEETPEPAHDLEADIVAADDLGDGTCRVTINRGLDDHVYPWLTGILGGKHGSQYSVQFIDASAGAAKAIVNTTLYMIQHDSTMTVIVNPTAKPAKPHSHGHKPRKH